MAAKRLQRRCYLVFRYQLLLSQLNSVGEWRVSPSSHSISAHKSLAASASSISYGKQDTRMQEFPMTSFVQYPCCKKSGMPLRSRRD